ncbi:ABC transporter permease [Paramagnetospirillum kuznetsovii]|uniref:ABC transporter permease n=1 Tax=Paramagnetospirillum kuznetsovii TaxID=2053833 RepID=A0A364NW47_9PROT|nr:TRAP transporter large permease subunit [Paramagnetospirillum kuznetsovii]RAU21314.1 ABC transporter permease [Paramagnetospirillum kuznetsovii]
MRISPEAADPVTGNQAQALLLRLDRGIGAVCELLAAILIVAETAILLSGVIARYVLHAPLTWSDELASILFLWLAMLGAVIALRRGEHMRLTILVNARGGIYRKWLDPLAAIVPVILLGTLLPFSLEHFEDEMLVMTPALGLSHSWRTSAMVVGIGLMALLSALRLLERGFDRATLQVVLAIALLAAVLFILRPLFPSLGYYNLLIFLVGLVITNVVLGVPIAFSFGVATLCYLAFATHVPLSVIVSRGQGGMEHLVLLSVPLFIILGLLLEMTGMARVMVELLVALLGHVRGGLSYVLLGAIFLVSGISGSKAADMAAVAPALFPEMKKRGYKPDELVAQLATSAAMSETIPPSLVLITIGSVTDVSMASLFTGGLLPAFVLCVALAVLSRLRFQGDHRSVTPRPPARHILRTLVIASPALALPFVIRAAVVEGVATATEVATIGIAYVVVCGLLVYRCRDWSRLMPLLVETAALTGAILFVFGMATAMGWSMTQSGLSRQLIAVMSGLPGGGMTFLLISIALFIVLGSVLEGIPALVLFAPLLFPIARVVGIHEVHYAMVAILAMGIGLFAPPLGIGYYTACAMGRVSPDQAMRTIWPYIGALIAALVLVAAVPWLSTCLL